MADNRGQIEALNYAVAQLYTTLLMESDQPEADAKDLREQWGEIEAPEEGDEKGDFFWELQEGLDHLGYLIQELVAEETGGEPPKS
ncbi:hypothetical protein [Thiohalorhabdus methylotrophus]|uniref:Uncharacterized protein n=1 Tax=Thiohalorhabdus methylotrophus TaxID=3242694 RepID=A0ABV4TQU2_9GAMM